MKITKTIGDALYNLIVGAVAWNILWTLFPGLNFLKGIICILSIWFLVELAKADLRADIRADVQREHEDTRVWLRDWFDPEHIHSVYVNESNEARDKEKQKWDRFKQLYPGTKKGETNDV